MRNKTEYQVLCGTFILNCSSQLTPLLFSHHENKKSPQKFIVLSFALHILEIFFQPDSLISIGRVSHCGFLFKKKLGINCTNTVFSLGL